MPAHESRARPPGVAIPQSYGHLFEQICTFNNLYQAYLKARRNKRYRDEVLAFSRNLEENLLTIREQLLAGTYRTGHYHEFVVHDRKTRTVRALPFRDRVVHHAICTIIEPLFEHKMISDSYACRVGKGTHQAADRLEHFLRCAKARWGTFYVLKADVHKYFPHIRHDVLLRILQRTIHDRRTMDLITEIVGSSHEPGVPDVGLPIGNLTSQLFANVYLDVLDHFIKEQLRCRYFCRYMDDFLLLAQDKATLHTWRQEIEQCLGSLGLTLNSKTQISPTAQGVEFLGYRMWPTHRLLRQDSVKRIRRDLRGLAKAYATGQISLNRVTQSIQSWLAHCQHAATYRLRHKLFTEQVFRRNHHGNTTSISCHAAANGCTDQNQGRGTKAG